MAAHSSSPQSKISFEVHVKRDDRWLAEEVFLEQDEALEYAEKLCQRRDLGGVRVIRETYDPERDDSFERVIFDTALEVPKPAPERPSREPAETGSTRPRQPTPQKRKPFPPGSPRSRE